MSYPQHQQSSGGGVGYSHTLAASHEQQQRGPSPMMGAAHPVVVGQQYTQQQQQYHQQLQEQYYQQQQLQQQQQQQAAVAAASTTPTTGVSSSGADPAAWFNHKQQQLLAIHAHLKEWRRHEMDIASRKPTTNEAAAQQNEALHKVRSQIAALLAQQTHIQQQISQQQMLMAQHQQQLQQQQHVSGGGSLPPHHLVQSQQQQQYFQQHPVVAGLPPSQPQQNVAPMQQHVMASSSQAHGPAANHSTAPPAEGINGAGGGVAAPQYLPQHPAVAAMAAAASGSSQQQQMPPQPPQQQQQQQSQRFGPYIVGETIGRGSFGKVKIAVHETTGVKVALKVIPRKSIEADARSQLKLQREIRVLRLLKHPHIMRLYDVVQTRLDIVLVLELVSGGELFVYLARRGRLEEAHARMFFQQFIAAVAHCHNAGVVHRDLKPENILVESSHRGVKIGDFGLSSLCHDGKVFETSCGTPNYAAPEVVGGRVYVGKEADVWSCGVVLFTMVAGTLPFDDEQLSQLFRKIQTANYTMPSFLSPAVQDLIGKILVVNPLERATTAQILNHPWVRESFPPYLALLHGEALAENRVYPVSSATAPDVAGNSSTTHAFSEGTAVSATTPSVAVSSSLASRSMPSTAEVNTAGVQGNGQRRQQHHATDSSPSTLGGQHGTDRDGSVHGQVSSSTDRRQEFTNKNEGQEEQQQVKGPEEEEGRATKESRGIEGTTHSNSIGASTKDAKDGGREGANDLEDAANKGGVGQQQQQEQQQEVEQSGKGAPASQDVSASAARNVSPSTSPPQQLPPSAFDEGIIEQLAERFKTTSEKIRDRLIANPAGSSYTLDVKDSRHTLVDKKLADSIVVSIPSADVALRSEAHDTCISYSILLDKKRNVELAAYKKMSAKWSAQTPCGTLSEMSNAHPTSTNSTSQHQQQGLAGYGGDAAAPSLLRQPGGSSIVSSPSHPTTSSSSVVMAVKQSSSPQACPFPRVGCDGDPMASIPRSHGWGGVSHFGASSFLGSVSNVAASSRRDGGSSRLLNSVGGSGHQQQQEAQSIHPLLTPAGPGPQRTAHVFSMGAGVSLNPASLQHFSAAANTNFNFYQQQIQQYRQGNAADIHSSTSNQRDTSSMVGDDDGTALAAAVAKKSLFLPTEFLTDEAYIQLYNVTMGLRVKRPPSIKGVWVGGKTLPLRDPQYNNSTTTDTHSDATTTNMEQTKASAPPPDRGGQGTTIREGVEGVEGEETRGQKEKEGEERKKPKKEDRLDDNGNTENNNEYPNRIYPKSSGTSEDRGDEEILATATFVAIGSGDVIVDTNGGLGKEGASENVLLGASQQNRHEQHPQEQQQHQQVVGGSATQLTTSSYADTNTTLSTDTNHPLPAFSSSSAYHNNGPLVSSESSTVSFSGQSAATNSASAAGGPSPPPRQNSNTDGGGGGGGGGMIGSNSSQPTGVSCLSSTGGGAAVGGDNNTTTISGPPSSHCLKSPSLLATSAPRRMKSRFANLPAVSSNTSSFTVGSPPPNPPAASFTAQGNNNTTVNSPSPNGGGGVAGAAGGGPLFMSDGKGTGTTNGGARHADPTAPINDANHFGNRTDSASLNNSLSQRHLALPPSAVATTTTNADAASAKQITSDSQLLRSSAIADVENETEVPPSLPSIYHCGVLFRDVSNGQVVMSLVYDILASEGFVWKAIRPFQLACAKFEPGPTKVFVRVFRAPSTPPDHNNPNRRGVGLGAGVVGSNYVVDVRLSGLCLADFTCVDVCAKLIDRLTTMALTTTTTTTTTTTGTSTRGGAGIPSTTTTSISRAVVGGAHLPPPPQQQNYSNPTSAAQYLPMPLSSPRPASQLH